MNIVEKVRHYEMGHLVGPKLAGEIRLPAQAVVQRQAGIDLPTILRIYPQGPPVLVVMREIQLGERTELPGDKIRHGIAGIRARERKQPVAENAKSGSLPRTNKTDPELQLMGTLGQAEVILQLVSLGVDETGSGESTGALEIARDVDVGIMGQSYEHALDSDVGGGDNRHLKLRDAVCIEREVECVQRVGAD